MLKMRRTNLTILRVMLLQLILIGAFVMLGIQLDYVQMSVMAIVYTLTNVILLKELYGLPVISVPNIFAFFSLFFHCGQLIKESFGIEGTVPLPFENYGDASIIRRSFIFFLLSQTLYYAGVTLFRGKSTRLKKWEIKGETEPSTYAKALVVIGIMPRLYIDILSLIGARTGGYEGVYSIYFPQMVQSMAFFFDAGMMLLLYGLHGRRTRRACFLVVVIYKCIMMSTGARQEKVAFLLVWIYVYFFVLNRITVRKLILLAGVGIAGFVFISAIGMARTGATVNLGQVFSLIQRGAMTNVLGGALGEFGSAFDTLEVAVRYTPSQIDYGYGRSYLAGILSIIPLLVNRIPALSETVMFVSQLPKSVTFALGGSFLGELYYNFSWFGVLGSIAIGAFMMRLHDGITDKRENATMYKAWCSILTTSMVLFVRGYFTDMMQKLVWTYWIICLVQMYVERKKRRASL